MREIKIWNGNDILEALFVWKILAFLLLLCVCIRSIVRLSKGIFVLQFILFFWKIKNKHDIDTPLFSTATLQVIVLWHRTIFFGTGVTYKRHIRLGTTQEITGQSETRDSAYFEIHGRSFLAVANYRTTTSSSIEYLTDSFIFIGNETYTCDNV